MLLYFLYEILALAFQNAVLEAGDHSVSESLSGCKVDSELAFLYKFSLNLFVPLRSVIDARLRLHVQHPVKSARVNFRVLAEIKKEIHQLRMLNFQTLVF